MRTGGYEMNDSRFMKAADIQEILGVSDSMAYKIIRQLNYEMIAKGYHTVRGRISRKYFEEVFYGSSAKED